jgi:hypothetical protein
MKSCFTDRSRLCKKIQLKRSPEISNLNKGRYLLSEKLIEIIENAKEGEEGAAGLEMPVKQLFLPGIR